jgi:hypothetical protein
MGAGVSTAYARDEHRAHAHEAKCEQVQWHDSGGN